MIVCVDSSLGIEEDWMFWLTLLKEMCGYV